MHSSHSSHFPSGGDIHHDLSRQIADALQAQITDNTSPLMRRLQGTWFQNETLIQLAIQDAFQEIWKSGVEKSASFGLLGNPDSLEKQRYKVHNELGDLARNVFEVIKPAVIKNGLGFTVNFDNSSVEKILARIEREKKGVSNAAHLIVGETNQAEKMALDRLVAMLKQAPARLRGELKKAGYPAKIGYDQFSEGKVFKALETVVLSSAFGFMTYGWHGLAYNGLDYLARNSRNAGQKGSMAETIITNPIAVNGITWGAGLFAATTIGYALIKGASRYREKLIQDAEASEKAGKPVKVGNFAERYGIFATAVAISITGAAFEAGGILAHEVQGIYTAQKAYEVGKAVDHILDLKNPNSPAGKVFAQYDTAPGLIDTQATNWYEAELRRPGASGVGPAAIAKQYLKDGNTVLQNPILARDPSLLGIVQGTETALTGLSPKSHSQNYTFRYKTEAVGGAYKDDIDRLRTLAYGDITYVDTDGKKIQTGGLYKTVYEKGGSAKTPDFLAAKDTFEKALGEFETNQNARTQKWNQITGVYQDYINRTSAASDAKYRSTTSFNAQIRFDNPDLSELRKKVAEVPKLEGKTVLEYWDELNKLTGVDGGITEAERAGIITLIALRSGVIEGIAAIMLFLGLMRVRRYYGRPNNLLSEKEKVLIHGHYENMIEGIQSAFSGSNWDAIFPDHPGISRDEAEYLARKVITKADPTLIEWFPIFKEGTSDGTQHIRKIGKNMVNVVKNIATGNTQTNREEMLAKLNRVLVSLSDLAQKDKTGLGIPLSMLAEVVRDVLPDEGVTGKIREIAPKFDAIVSEIARRRDTLESLTTQTVEHSAIQNEAQLQDKIEEMGNWIEGEMSIWKQQIENLMRNNTTHPQINEYDAIYHEMITLELGFQSKTDPSFSDLSEWNRKKITIVKFMTKK